MDNYQILALIGLGWAASGFFGYLQGRATVRRIDEAWANGYAAGLAKADQMWPSVNRWEMR
jgi:hypothetical protein